MSQFLCANMGRIRREVQKLGYPLTLVPLFSLGTPREVVRQPTSLRRKLRKVFDASPIARIVVFPGMQYRKSGRPRREFQVC